MPAQIIVYVTAIFLTYPTLGVMMMAGIDALLPSFGTMASSRLGFIVRGLIGLAMLLADLGERLQAGARETILWIFGLVGGGLLVWSIVEYVARFVISRN